MSKTPDSMDFLLANISHLHYTRAHQLLEAIGLYRGQPPVLFALWEQEGLAQSDLSERMRVTPATITRMLQRMEKAGFIRRCADAQDQRVTRVYLTDAGRSVKGKVEEVWRRMEDETFGDFTLEERLLLRRFLLQMRQNLAEAVGEEPWK